MTFNAIGAQSNFMWWIHLGKREINLQFLSCLDGYTTQVVKDILLEDR